MGIWTTMLLCLGVLELYRVTLDAEDLYRAVEVAGRMCGLFMDQENGGFYLYASDGEKLISRPKETYDGAMPSGNSVAALCWASCGGSRARPSGVTGRKSSCAIWRVLQRDIRRATALPCLP